MKKRRLEDIEAVVASSSFKSWLEDLVSTRSELRDAEERGEGLLDRAFHLELDCERDQKKAMDALERSADEEAQVAGLLSEVSRIENSALEKLGSYEEQRFRASDAWVRLGAVERRLEEARESRGAVEEQADDGASSKDPELTRLVREHRSVHEIYERECERKARLWSDVESLWDRAMELGLLAAEKQTALARRKRQAERLFRASAQKQEEARTLREEAESLVGVKAKLKDSAAGYLIIAREQFGAIAGESFLYWPCEERDKQVWCVSLVRDVETYNIEVEPETVYRVGARDGVSRIEPLTVHTSSSEKDRVEAWFRDRPALKARPTEDSSQAGLVDEISPKDGKRSAQEVGEGSSTEEKAAEG